MRKRVWVCNRGHVPSVAEMLDDTGTTDYDYNNGDQLTLVTRPDSSTTAYTYDENGNQTQAGSRTYTYDLADRLISTTQSSVTTSYSYDGDGVRRSRTHDGTTHSELWDTNHQLPQLALERGSGGATLRAYLHGLEPIAFISDDDPYLHTDRLGSVHNITDETGDTQWTYNYDPYGNPISETKNDPNAPVNRLRYTGQYHDPTTSDYHLRARTYNPTTGRFHTLDPEEGDKLKPLASPYVYAGSGPTRFVDPSGKSFFECFKHPGRCLEKTSFFTKAKEKRNAAITSAAGTRVPHVVGGFGRFGESIRLG